MKFTMHNGVDAPFWVSFLILVGFVFTLLGIVSMVHSFVLAYGLLCLITCLWMFLYSTMIKLAHREVSLNFAQIKSGDSVLDVGTGRGLIAIVTAQRGCKVTAIDRWSKWDLGGSNKSALQSNIKKRMFLI